MKLTAQQINERIAEMHSPQPESPDYDFDPFDESYLENPDWVLSWDEQYQYAGAYRWEPRWDYTDDDGAACKLLDEMPKPGLSKTNDGEWLCYSGQTEDDVACYESTRALAICIAYLMWRGIEVEVAK